MLLRQYEAMLTIQSCRYFRNIWPWRQNNLYMPEWVFYWNALPGGCIRTVSGITRMTPDYFYIIPGNMHYSTFAEQPFEHFHIHFRPNEWIKPPQDIVIIPCDESVMKVIRDFLEMTGKPGMLMCETLCAYSILSTVLLKLPLDMLLLSSRFDERVEKACELIRKNPGHHYSNEELASCVGMARNSFLTLFRNNTGETPQKYGKRKRIENACRLLHFSDASIEAIAEACGFADRYHFTRVFAHTAGVPPGEFRSAAKQWRDSTPGKEV